jgi:hypothetical protein
MSPSSVTHDTLTRQPLWRGSPAPTCSSCRLFCWHWVSYSRPSRLPWPKRAFDVIINDTTALSALVVITVAAIGALTAIATGLAMRSRHRAAAALDGALWIAIGVAMALNR